MVEGQNEVLLVAEIDLSFIVKRRGRGAERWESIREGVNLLSLEWVDEGARGLRRRGTEAE